MTETSIGKRKWRSQHLSSAPLEFKPALTSSKRTVLQLQFNSPWIRQAGKHQLRIKTRRSRQKLTLGLRTPIRSIQSSTQACKRSLWCRTTQAQFDPNYLSQRSSCPTRTLPKSWLEIALLITEANSRPLTLSISTILTLTKLQQMAAFLLKG